MEAAEVEEVEESGEVAGRYVVGEDPLRTRLHTTEIQLKG